MSINNSYSALTKFVTHIQNPNKQLGVLLEEVPSDIGRSYEGYKRGGIIEGAEKMRKELFSAAVWLFGIPFFKIIGDKIFEKIFKVPMKVDFSSIKEGNDAIGDTLRYVLKGENPHGLDVSELSKKYIDKFAKYAKENVNIEELAKKVSIGKKVTSVIAVVLNCLMMGVVLPKINQRITRNKLKEQKRDKFSPKFASMKEFQEKNKTNKNISFTGFFGDIARDVKNNGVSYTIGYNTENNNTFRLIITDIPMIIGRVITSRNKFEGLENLFMDGASIFFYNFCSGMVQKGLRKLSGIKQTAIPDIKPIISETINQISPDVLQKAFETLENNKDLSKISEILPKESVDAIYKAGTFGKFGKINKFVKTSELSSIDESVFKFLNYIKSKQTDMEPLFKDGTINTKLIGDITSKVNKANAGFLGLGLLSSIIGLSIIVPKTTFWITRKLTGRNEFTGIANYDDLEKKKEVKA